MKSLQCRQTGLAISCVLALSLAGCSRGDDRLPVAASDAYIRLSHAAGWYAKFTERHKRTPEHATEFLAFVKSLPAQDLPVPAEEVASYLVSPRDKKALVICCNLASTRGTIALHEAEGDKGKRFVGYAATGQVELVEEARFQELMGKPSGSSPP